MAFVVGGLSIFNDRKVGLFRIVMSSGNTIPWTYNTEWPTGFITAYLVSIAEEFFVSDMTGTEFLDTLTDAFVTAANE